jgi:uncharacterized protein (TIGR02145 family)
MKKLIILSLASLFLFGCEKDELIPSDNKPIQSSIKDTTPVSSTVVILDTCKIPIYGKGGGWPLPILLYQTWKTKDLDVTKYNNGDPIPEVSPEVLNTIKTGAWTRGRNGNKLYNWYAIEDPRGIEPPGYHIPTSTDLHYLRNSLYDNSRPLISKTPWSLGTPGGSDTYGFNCLLTSRIWDGKIDQDLSSSYYWYGKSGSNNSTTQSCFYLGNDNNRWRFGSLIVPKNTGNAIRLIKD